MPLTHLRTSLETFHRELGLYPVWLCPVKMFAQVGHSDVNNLNVVILQPGMLRTPSGKDEMYVDIGLYGVPRGERFDAERTMCRLEEFVRNIGGFQMMYADSFMTREEFREMFDHTLYDRYRSTAPSSNSKCQNH